MDLPILILAVFLLISTFTAWVFYFSIRKKLRMKDEESRASFSELSRLRKDIQKYELENRDIYLNPHIFKNTLNAIRNYAFKTHLALDNLGGVLDYILYESKVNFTSIRKELDFIKDFIELNKFRLHPLLDFKVSIDIDEEDDELYNKEIILPLITVDFIENAFKHGDLSGDKGFIHISMRLNRHIFRYEVINAVNPKPVISASKGGLGQKKLKERLEMIYGDLQELTFYSENNIYKAQLILKINEIDRKMHIA